MEQSEGRRDAWNAYWAGNAASSCPVAGSAAGDPLFDFWQPQFRNLDGGAHVLDLGTGNGAVLRQAVSNFPKAVGWRLEGIDIADPNPSWLDASGMPNIRFQGGVEMEHLPFPDGSFDLITSQFGIEYGRFPEVQDEAMRVLKSGGHMGFVIHHACSVITAVAKDEAAIQAFLLAPEGLIAAATDILPWMAQIRAGRQLDMAQAQAARARYNAQMAEVQMMVDQLKAPDLLLEAREWLHKLLVRIDIVHLDAALRSLEEMKKAIAYGALRTNQQVEVALDADGISHWTAPWRKAGAQVDINEARRPEGLIAWTVNVRAP